MLSDRGTRLVGMFDLAVGSCNSVVEQYRTDIPKYVGHHSA
jgi:hypothetical protein